jgi:DNA-binding NarL/FixJ family response regulator
LLASLAETPPFLPVDLGGGGEETCERLERLRPDVILVDIPPSKFAAFIRSARRDRPGLVILAVNSDETEEELMSLFEAGLSGFIPREAESADIPRVIRLALDGEFECPPRIASLLLRRLHSAAQNSNGARPPARLTPREKQVARFLEHGLSNKQIATRLNIEVSTAKNHVHSILQKLTAKRRAEAVRKLHGQASPDAGCAIESLARTPANVRSRSNGRRN